MMENKLERIKMPVKVTCDKCHKEEIFKILYEASLHRDWFCVSPSGFPDSDRILCNSCYDAYINFRSSDDFSALLLNWIDGDRIK